MTLRAASDNQSPETFHRKAPVQWDIALPSGSGLSRDLSDLCTPLPTYAQSRGRKPRKNRASATAAPRKRLDNSNHTLVVSRAIARHSSALRARDICFAV